MINLDTVTNLAKSFEKYNSELKRYEKQFRDYKIQYGTELEDLIKEKNKIEDPIEREEFIQKNQILNQYDICYWQIRMKEKMIRRLLYGINYEELAGEKIRLSGIPYILLKHLYDDSYDLVNLRQQEIINLNDLREIEQEFLIKLLECQNVLIGSATVSDLPLLMNILEDENFDEKVGTLKMLHKCIDSKREYQRAKLFDKHKHNSRNIEVLRDEITNPITKEQEEVQYKLPFIYGSSKIEEMWYRLDELRLSEEDYWTLYYKYVMLFANDIDVIYNEASDDLKDYVIDTYYDFSKGKKYVFLDNGEILDEDSYNDLDDKDDYKILKEEYIQFRTASSLINTEVLKRKYVKIK